MSEETKTELGQIIARNAKGLRKSHGLTLQEVADRGGLAKSYVWEIENGKNTNPSISTLVSLCTALGCSLDGLVGREVYMTPQLRPEAMRIAVEVDTLIRAALDTRDSKIARFQASLHTHQPLFKIRAGKEPCGECHLQPSETCDICGAAHAKATQAQP